VDERVHEFVFTVLEELVHVITFCLLDALNDYLFSGLSRDTSVRHRGYFHANLLIEFDVLVELLSVVEGNLSIGVFDLIYDLFNMEIVVFSVLDRFHFDVLPLFP
jgi:hypothetical protein